MSADLLYHSFASLSSISDSLFSCRYFLADIFKELKQKPPAAVYPTEAGERLFHGYLVRGMRFDLVAGDRSGTDPGEGRMTLRKVEFPVMHLGILRGNFERMMRR